MQRSVGIDPSGGTIRAGIRVIDHIAVTALDLWDDTDRNGRPDLFLRQIKDPNVEENRIVEIGEPSGILGKVLQWIWMPSQPPDSADDWVVELHLEQAKTPLEGFPLRLRGPYPSGEKYGLFQTWVRFVEARGAG